MKRAPKIIPGTVLISNPYSFPDDIYLTRSVCLVTHADKYGIECIILNKDSKKNIDEIAPDAIPDLNSKLFIGGPENEDLLSYIHNIPELKNSTCLGKDLYVNGDYEQLLGLINLKLVNPKMICFYLGSWWLSASELRKERRTGNLFVSPYKIPNLSVLQRTDGLWDKIRRGFKNVYSNFYECPINPTCN